MKDFIFHCNDLIFHSFDVLPYDVVFDSLQIVCFFSIHNLMCFKLFFFQCQQRSVYLFSVSTTVHSNRPLTMISDNGKSNFYVHVSFFWSLIFYILS